MSNAGTRIRFQCDEDFHGAIVRGLRRSRPTMGIQTAAEAGMIGLSDPFVLAHTAAQGRILLSHDTRTMPGHFSAFLNAGHFSPRLIFVPQRMSIGLAIQDILLIWEASTSDEYRNLIMRLPL